MKHILLLVFGLLALNTPGSLMGQTLNIDIPACIPYNLPDSDETFTIDLNAECHSPLTSGIFSLVYNATDEVWNLNAEVTILGVGVTTVTLYQSQDNDCYPSCNGLWIELLPDACDPGVLTVDGLCGPGAPTPDLVVDSPVTGNLHLNTTGSTSNGRPVYESINGVYRMFWTGTSWDFALSATPGLPIYSSPVGFGTTPPCSSPAVAYSGTVGSMSVSSGSSNCTEVPYLEASSSDLGSDPILLTRQPTNFNGKASYESADGLYSFYFSPTVGWQLFEAGSNTEPMYIGTTDYGLETPPCGASGSLTYLGTGDNGSTLNSELTLGAGNDGCTPSMELLDFSTPTYNGGAAVSLQRVGDANGRKRFLSADGTVELSYSGSMWELAQRAPLPETVMFTSTVDVGIEVPCSDNNSWQGVNAMMGEPATIIGDCTAATVLPVEWVQFRGTPEGNVVLLNWITGSELNNDHFVVEHSTDGRSFEGIGRVTGAGTSNNEQYYTYRHDTRATGSHYYRLRQVDFDGKSDYSATISVNLEGISSSEAQLLPNPTPDGIVRLTGLSVEGPVQVRVVNLSGQVLRTLRYNEISTGQSLHLDLSAFPRGTYLIQVATSKERLSQLLHY